MSLSASEAFDLEEIRRCQYDGCSWVVFDDGAYRHVVESGHYDSCGYEFREPDDEWRASDYSAWCMRGKWADDATAAVVAGLCGLTHVHSATSGGCGRIDAKEVTDG